MSLIKKIFGPSRQDIWSQIAAEYDGEFKKGTFLKKDKVRAFSGEWEIYLDHFARSTGKSSIPYTRIRAPFINKDNLYFKVYREGFFTGIAKYFGMQDIKLNNDEFDNQFVLKGNDVFKISWIFESSGVKKHLYNVDKILLEIKDGSGVFKASRYEEGLDELYFERTGILKDIHQLRAIFDLFGEVLEKITELDSGYA